HQVGQPSSNNVIEMTWSQQLNVQAYSVLWSQNAAQQPEAIANLPGNAAGAQSPPLTPGEWYFNLRTQGKNGLWTSTVHIGPFVISLPQPTATPSYTPTPTFTFTATDMPTPIPTDTPLPTATATHTPRPTNTSTPRPTDTFTPIATDTPTDTPPPPEQPPPPPEQPTPPHPPPPPPP
ncbi:MAG TPA: hypothetical protein VJ020_08775, partial [Anaerolineales bacterium]|nr:hypothetical protein [Anaerolineales bacterium]